MHNSFIENMQKTADGMNPNVSVTENGAVGYETTGKALLDLNFKLSSMRNWTEDKIWNEFLHAYNENPVLSVVWLFFARDVRGGTGERRTFRVIFKRLAYENPELAIKLLRFVPEYGRWDDVVDVFCGDAPCKVRDAALNLIKKQWHDDVFAYNNNGNVSLMAKWLPSENTSSNKTCGNASKVRTALGYTSRDYRRIISRLRKRIDVTEQKMSANQWGDISYESVPSKAGLLYHNAFVRHDGHRYQEYLSDVASGKAKMNSDTLFPYEIVHAYMCDDYWVDSDLKPYDETLELKWKNLPNSVKNGGDTLVVVDGSGSMSSRVGKTSITCHDVARSLGIYFAERLSGPFKNSFITFSSSPKVVKFVGVNSLRSKLEILIGEDDCSNTDIEKTFDLILKTAVDNNLKQEDLPSNVLIVSDMEFDSLKRSYGWEWPWHGTHHPVDERLFDAIKKKFDGHGYKLPRLVFWNVCSRSETIPVTENELGVALVSGFSPSIADMVMSGEIDPWKALVNKLRSERYAPVFAAVMRT